MSAHDRRGADDSEDRLRAALRDAFDNATELDPQPDFSARLRGHLRGEAERDRAHLISRRAWLGLAAGLVVAVGVTGRLVVDRRNAWVEDLARDAIGDHRNCALKYRKVRMPVPLPEAAANIDGAYGLLLTAPPDEVSTPGGPVRVVDRHACAYEGRRFGHVIMDYRGHVVSLLMTEGKPAAGQGGSAGVPHTIGQPSDGLSVVSVNARNRAILVVGDLESAELTQLATSIATPLALRVAE